MKFQYKLPFYKQNIFEVLLLAKAICFVNCEVLLETYTEILIDLYLLPWISYFVFHKTKWKSQTQNTTWCHNHCHHNHYCQYYFRTKKFFKTLRITSLYPDDHCYWMLWKFRIRWNLHETASFIIIRKCDITKYGPGNITKFKDNANTKSKYYYITMILTKHILYVRGGSLMSGINNHQRHLKT